MNKTNAVRTSIALLAFALVAPFALFATASTNAPDGAAAQRAANAPDGAAAQRATENVILVTLDGLRWEDLFRGAAAELLTEDAGGVVDVAGTRATFWRDSAEARRDALMPFLWSLVDEHGQIFGNADRGSEVRVTNGRVFSYPGYNEMLAGFVDDRIDSNAKRLNPNATVLEWLHGRQGFGGRVAAFTSWDVFPFILNEPRSGVPVNSGWENVAPGSGNLTDRQELLNELMEKGFHPSEGVRDDAMTWYAALEYLAQASPRVMYISLDRTDTAAHNGRYDLYLEAARKSDDMLRDLWETLQSNPLYSGRTSLVITTDHGRGGPPQAWRDHGADVQGADFVWLAVIGPDVEPLGERSGTPRLTQSQVAATLASLVGEDYAGSSDGIAVSIFASLDR